MYFTKKQQWYIFLTANGLLLFVLLFFPFYNDHLAATSLTLCRFHMLTGLYCMGCGATRAFSALMRFKILDAFQYNPAIPIGALVFIIYEIIMIVYLIRGKKRPMLLKTWFVWILLGFWFVYSIVRNILLLNGIDIVLGTGL